MRDHNFNGTPVSKMVTEDIHDCLDNGIVVNDCCGYSIFEALFWVRIRLEIEIVRRRLGLGIRQPDGSLA